MVNSIAPEFLEKNPNFHKLTKKQIAQISFDPDDDDDVEPKYSLRCCEPLKT